jgi:hypothetical protein
MEDWNWFFTALAQSNAAIAGFLGGFTITKILGKESEYNRYIEQIETLRIRISDQKRRLDKRFFSWYNKRRRSSAFSGTKYEDLVLKGNGALNLEEVLPKLDFSRYDSKEEILERISSEWGTYKAKRYGSIGSIPISPNITISQNEMDVEEGELIENERVSTLSLIEEIGLTVRAISSFPRENRSIYWTLAMIFMLFVVGVIYPLSFTPSSGAPSLCSFDDFPRAFSGILFSVKGFFLASSLAIFGLLFLFFILKVRNLKFSAQVREDLTESQSLGSYSVYLKNWESWNM